jgi:hypothetical protein
MIPLVGAGAPKYSKAAAGIWHANDIVRDAERELAQQAETSYRGTVPDQKAGGPTRQRVGARATPERAEI